MLALAQQHLFDRDRHRAMPVGRQGLSRRVVLMASDALGRNLPSRAMASDAVRFDRHKNVSRITALRSMMAIVAFDAGVFGVIKIRAHHPAIDQNRLGDDRRTDRGRCHFVAEPAADEGSARRRGRPLRRFVGIGCKKNAAD